MKRMFLMLFIFIALVTMANAAVLYKCIDNNGNKIFTDNPPRGAKCESRYEDNKSTPREGPRADVHSYPRVTIDSALPQAETSESLVYNYYIASADPTRLLGSILDTSSPIRQNGKVFHAHTDWHVKCNFRWFENPDGRCKVTNVSTELIATINLPRLVGATSMQQSQFDIYLSALRIHELGHYGICKEAPAAINRKILSLPEMPICKNLESAANDLAYRTIDEYKQRQVQYDASTKHGKSQGAWLY